MNNARPQPDDDDACRSWRRWPTRREWLFIAICICWPLGLHLTLHFGRSHQVNEYLARAIFPVCFGLILATRSWQIGRFWLLALIFGGGLTSGLRDHEGLQHEKHLIAYSAFGLIVGLLWNDACRLFKAVRPVTQDTVEAAEPSTR